MNSNENLIVALDVDTFEEARQLVDRLEPVVPIFKVGSQLFTACGPVIVRYLMARGKKVFLDLKWHDIPNTVANAVQAAVGLSAEVHQVMDQSEQAGAAGRGIFMCTVHILGGEEMLRRAMDAAKKSAESLKVPRPRIVGITVLTSDAKTDNITSLVLERARLARHSGLDGIVASSQEARMIRKEFGKDFIIVTPGIRPQGSESGDQKRVTTPRDAISNGSDYLVVGRPIVHAQDPFTAAQNILKDISDAQK